MEVHRCHCTAMELSVLLLLLLSVSLSWGQFPAVCNTDDSLETKTCCPNDCGRGSCVNVSGIVTKSWSESNQTVVNATKPSESNSPVDVRYQWPLCIFKYVCKCDAGWGGYDCGRCDFGYVMEGGECVAIAFEQLPVQRKSFSALTVEEQDEYIAVIKAAKNEQDKEWAVVVSEPSYAEYNSGSTTSRFELQNVSTYDMFVALHFLGAREKDNEACKKIYNDKIDFAHENLAFLTWHRYYLLIVETELRRVAKNMGISDFSIAYWDWTPNDREVFRSDRFGVPQSNSSGPTTVTGSLFNNNDWPIVCDQHYTEYNNDSGREHSNCSEVRKLCNVNEDRDKMTRLQRGVIILNPNEPPEPFLPDNSTINIALAANNFSEFRKRLEGFVDLCGKNSPPCTIHKTGAHNNLHNAVHIFIGGHMRVVASASNDPIFFLHHANIDRIFEAWLQRFDGSLPSFQPDTELGRHPGHNLNDYLVPFFPLKTNADMYKLSDKLGFHYDSLPWSANDVDAECPAQSTCTKGDTSDSPTSTPTSSPTSSTSDSPTSSTSGSPTSPTSPDSSQSMYQVPLLLVFLAATTAFLMLAS